MKGNKKTPHSFKLFYTPPHKHHTNKLENVGMIYTLNMKKNVHQYAVRLFWMIINPLLHAYWFLVRPKTSGAKCLVENDGAFLLVRINYGHKRWTIPGGGIQKGETSETAAIRELREETGISATHVRKLGEYINTHQYKIDTVYVYYYLAPTRAFSIDEFEVGEAQWFKPDQLPSDRMPSVDKILAMRRPQPW